MTERWQLKPALDGGPSSHIIGLADDESTIVAVVEVETREERERAALICEAPLLFQFARLCIELARQYGDDDYRVKLGPAAFAELRAIVRRVEAAS